MGIENCTLSFEVSYVTNREHGTRPVPLDRGGQLADRAGRDDIRPTTCTTFRNLVAFYG